MTQYSRRKGVSTVTVSQSAMIADPANPGSYKIPLFTAPKNSLFVVLGYSVTTAFDDSQGGSLSVGDPAATELTNLDGSDLTANIHTVKSIFYKNATDVALFGIYGDGTVGQLTVYYQLIPLA